MIGKMFFNDQMTSRRRLLAAYRGEPVDRMPWWAKICNNTWKAGQPEIGAWFPSLPVRC